LLPAVFFPLSSRDKQNCPQAKIIVPKPVARWLMSFEHGYSLIFSDMDRTTTVSTNGCKSGKCM
jgi:hypothetical protein